MKFYDISLQQLHDMAAEKKHIESKLTELQSQADMYELQTAKLRAVYRYEQKDVEDIEGRSLVRFFTM